jgi:dihydropteroate synthase
MKFNLHLTTARNHEEARVRLAATRCSSAGTDKMASKMRHYCFKLEGVPAAAALILKQEMLSTGGEAAIPAGALDHSIERGEVILMGTVRHYLNLAEKIKPQPFGLKELARDLSVLLENVERTEFIIPTRKRDLVMNDRPLLMGIVNVTPDSFYDGGRYEDIQKAADRVLELEAEGADIIDIGGESTRPGSEGVSPEEELRRVIPVIESVSPRLKVPISIDTQKAGVARSALQAGADIINDISALSGPVLRSTTKDEDENMAELAAEQGVPLIIMHMKGTPKNMQDNPKYDDLFGEIIAFLRERIHRAVAKGVNEDRIIVDPGIGFGKTVEHNLELVRDLWRLRSLGRPILLGPSNKSFIGKVLGAEKDDRYEGTAASLVAAILSGANILRVHDVKGMKRFTQMAAAIRAGRNL